MTYLVIDDIGAEFSAVTEDETKENDIAPAEPVIKVGLEDEGETLEA